MSDIAGQESTSEYTEAATEAPAESIQTEDHSTEQQPSNPFWGEVEKLTGPNVYKLIQPHLAKADTEARQRVESVNQSYAPWKQLVDQGITPEHVMQSIGVVRQLNDPQGQLQIYESLRNFLRENGRLPDQQELQEQVEEDTDPENDPRFDNLAKQQQAIVQFLQAQQQREQQAQIDQEADAWADNEWKRVTQAHPELSREDLADVAQILAAQTNRGEEPNLDNAVAAFSAMRDRIRTTPRPGQNAPRIPSGVGGGTPQGGAIDPSNLSKDQRRELVAQMLQRGNQQ